MLSHEKILGLSQYYIFLTTVIVAKIIHNIDIYLQTPEQSPLSGPYDRDEGNLAEKEGRELASLSD